MIDITVFGAMSQLKGDVPLNALRAVTSYPVEGHKFNQAFRKGLWDGRKHLMKRSGVFPTGLLSTVTEMLDSQELKYTLHDTRELPSSFGSPELRGVSFAYPYDYQADAIATMMDKKCGIIKIGTGGGKTAVACGFTKAAGVPTLFCVTTVELLHQARKVFQEKLGGDANSIGAVGDGIWEPGSWVTVAIINTLVSRKDTEEVQELLARTKLLFLDEAHHLGSETWYDVACLCPAVLRFGLSATPNDRSDGGGLRLIAATGPVIVDVPNKLLVERGIVARANIVWDKISGPILPKKITYQEAYQQGVTENTQLRDKVIEWTKVCTSAGLSTLILVEHIKHGDDICNALWAAGIVHQFIHGNESSDVRKEVLEQFGNRDLQVMVASKILDEGVDCYSIDALILAGSRKSRIKTMQRLGRGLRGDKLIVIEFANFCHDYLLEHSQERYEDYKREECFPIYSSSPSLALVERLWKK